MGPQCIEEFCCSPRGVVVSCGNDGGRVPRVVNDMLWLGARQETAKLRKEVQISKAALEASQAAAKKADADLSAAKAAADAAAAGKTAADKVV